MTNKQIIINFNFEKWFACNKKLMQDLREKIFGSEQEYYRVIHDNRELLEIIEE